MTPHRCHISFLISLLHSRGQTHVLVEFHSYNPNIAKSCNMTPSTVSDFIFDIFVEFLDFFGLFPVSFMKNVRAVFEKPIISGEKPVKYRKSKNPAQQRNAK